MNQNASLIEALQALATEMAKASTEDEAEAGLKRLRQIRADCLSPENGDDAVNAAHRNAEALVACLEARLEQLKLQLARRRRVQEGEVMEQVAKQREAEGPSLLPTELVDAVVHATNSRDPEEITSTAPVSVPAKEEETAARKKLSGKKKEKNPDTPKKQPAFVQTKSVQKTPVQTKPEQKTPVQTKPEQKIPVQTKPVQKTPVQTKPEPTTPVQTKSEQTTPVQTKPEQPHPTQTKPAGEKAEFTKFECLAAHLAASVGENSFFFEKLGKAAKRPGKAQKAPANDKAAETHYRRIHDLGKRLVNLELHAKAIARAKEKQEPVSPLVKTAARELKFFLREFKRSKEESPEMAGEYERRFGGWAEQFSAMKPEKGQAILDQCRDERQARKPAAETEPERETDAPQLVLKRDDYLPQ